MRVSYSKNCTTVYNSYLIKDITKAVDEIINYRLKHNFPVTRAKDSYVSEWKAHNRLYKLGLFKSHTKNVDLEENLSKKNELIWKILGGF